MQNQKAQTQIEVSFETLIKLLEKYMLFESQLPKYRYVYHKHFPSPATIIFQSLEHLVLIL